jgi:serine/threonine protein kinase
VKTPAESGARDLLDRLVDGDPIDWSHGASGDPSLLDALHTLDQVRSAYQRIGAAPVPNAPVLFQWGPLSVQEKIGCGASAEVYRAWDAGLATPVALKLLRPEAAAAGLRSDEFLHEGRLLARLSQRNVLRVYGAAVHDGRPGIWNEWIEGRTLDAIVVADGPFADAEVIHVGSELCAALAAIHAAGLLHGDVKASNVLRARGGRIVLADLGAAGAPDTLNGSLRTQATPAYLSPQSRDGAPRAPSDDLYALGVLLHFLASGQYPHDGVSRLRELKPTIDRRLAEVVERALSSDPRSRFASAHTFGDALLAPRPSARKARVSFTLPLLLVAGLVATVAAGYWWTAPAPAWQQQAVLARRTDSGSEPLRDGATLQLGERINLKLSANRPTWAYVLNEDESGALHVLFPLVSLAQANPLPADVETQLPGQQAGRALSWEVSSSGGREEFLVVLADRPLRDLERRLEHFAGASVEATERGVGRIAGQALANVSVRGRHLNALLAESAAELADTRHVRVLSYHFETAAPR